MVLVGTNRMLGLVTASQIASVGAVVLLPLNVTKQIRELLWHRDNPHNMRACRALVREQARLSLAYERRHGKAPKIKHV
jgi:hypothetical protein